jgi:Mg2+ and Co2+ transporter CorA
MGSILIYVLMLYSINLDDEAAIYARYEFATKRTFVLLIGTDRYVGIGPVQIHLANTPNATMFHVIFNVFSTILDATEKVRWNVDFETQSLESQTGVATLTSLSPAVAAKELKFNKSLQVTTDFAKNLAWGSRRVGLNLDALTGHIEQFEKLLLQSGGDWPDTCALQNLREACNMKRELARNQYDQILQLQARLSSQNEITDALMKQRDTHISLDIAEATRKDSEMMRGTAAVTMIFFPATFVATFFSMVFFHVGAEGSVHLLVDKKIWLYPVVTIPLTALITVWYYTWLSGRSWKDVFQCDDNKRKPTIGCPSTKAEKLRHEA